MCQRAPGSTRSGARRTAGNCCRWHGEAAALLAKPPRYKPATTLVREALQRCPQAGPQADERSPRSGSAVVIACPLDRNA